MCPQRGGCAISTEASRSRPGHGDSTVVVHGSRTADWPGPRTWSGASWPSGAYVSRLPGPCRRRPRRLRAAAMCQSIGKHHRQVRSWKPHRSTAEVKSPSPRSCGSGWASGKAAGSSSRGLGTMSRCGFAVHRPRSRPAVSACSRAGVPRCPPTCNSGIDFADALHHASYKACATVATFDDRRFALRARRLGMTPAVTILSSCKPQARMVFEEQPGQW